MPTAHRGLGNDGGLGKIIGGYSSSPLVATFMMIFI